MNQRFRRTGQYCTELREMLNEANNKISRTFLEKAILSTQVLKLEKELKKLKREMSDRENQLPQEELEELTTKNRSDNSQNTQAEAGEVIEKMLQLKASMEAALTRIKSDSEVLLLELDKHHLELQKCRKQKQLQAGEEGKHSGRAQDTETMTK
ncbi:hypothetical protein D4764_13G0005970 [Takifugu flavidus]|uniref:Uncharacterized protein n=1 Tax=Takifugu flavidus TaxID=433684 RepID=A0A5C6P944_9TELE|nr:hypothetical protein D4764_13G0005970 [Takifugu flavidus]